MRRFAIVRFRLTARLHRVFAKSVRDEADARRVQYKIGPMSPPDRIERHEGWLNCADWLEKRAADFDALANQANEPRFK